MTHLMSRTPGLLSVFTSTLFASILFVALQVAAEDKPINENPMVAKAHLKKEKVAAGEQVQVQLDLSMPEHHHAYLEKFKVRPVSPEGLKVGSFEIDPIVDFFDKTSGKNKRGMAEKATMLVLTEFPTHLPEGKAVGAIELEYQACTPEYCLFPKKLKVEFDYEIVSAQASSSISSSGLMSGQLDIGKSISENFLFAFLLVFLAGVLTSLTPCVFPMIPITLAILGARTTGQSKLKSFSISASYVLGIAITYAGLGVFAASTGALFGSMLSNPFVVAAIAFIFVLMGLSMYGAFEMQPPAFIRDRLSNTKTGVGLGGAFISGIIAGVVASPCVGPVLVSILTYVAKSQNLFLGFWLLFVFAIGLGQIFIVLGTFSSLLGKIPRSGPWMEVVKFTFGTMMIGMALFYVDPVLPDRYFQGLVGLSLILISSAFGAFMTNTEADSPLKKLQKGQMLAVFFVGVVMLIQSLVPGFGFAANSAVPGASAVAQESYPKLKWQEFKEETLQTALKDGKPVIIDFFAEWCGACKELEKYTFTDAEVRSLSEKFVLLKIDATEGSEELDKLKSRYGVMGLPTMIFYDSKGKERKEVTLTGFEEAPAFLARMKQML